MNKIYSCTSCCNVITRSDCKMTRQFLSTASAASTALSSSSIILRNKEMLYSPSLIVTPLIMRSWNVRNRVTYPGITVSKRCYHKTNYSPIISLLKEMGRRAYNIYKGDDHINPKKILERKYIYLTLLAIHFRNLRLLEQQRSQDDGGRAVTAETEKEKLNRLYEQSVEELDQLKLDSTTNVDLRLLLQKYLQPQVKSIFHTFHIVDEQLGIPQVIESYNLIHEQQAKDDDGSNRNDDNVDSDEITTTTKNSVMDENLYTFTYRDLLWNEFEYTQQQLSHYAAPQPQTNNEIITDDDLDESSRNQNQINFLMIKQQAILSLLRYHDWLDDSNGRNIGPISDLAPAAYEMYGLDPFGMKIDETALKDSNTIRMMKQYQTINICRSALIRRQLGYSVLALRSSIPNAGCGLYIDGSVMAGAIVAFQPGDVWPKEHLLTEAPEVMEHFDDDDEDCQTSLRFDDYVIDSRQSPVVVLCRDGSLNPWALGNMINHPSPSPPYLPNCQSVMLNYIAKTQLNELVRYIPNSYAKLPTWQSQFFELDDVIMHGLCLVSRLDVQDEELLYDYRLQSDSTPDWYSIVKYDNQLETDQVVFFRDDWRNKRT